MTTHIHDLYTSLIKNLKELVKLKKNSFIFVTLVSHSLFGRNDSDIPQRLLLRPNCAVTKKIWNSSIFFQKNKYLEFI